MREQKFRFIFKDGNFFAKRYMTLDELLDSNFALEQMEESINSESNIFDIEDYPDYEVFKDEYTGLKDKNNMEIYEGDIFSFVIFDYLDNAIPYISSVVFQQGSFGVLIKNSYNEECFYELYHILSQYDEAKVIGNIYENKDLLSEVNNG